MFGIVNARTALENSNTIGIKNVYLQYSLIITPIMTDPTTLPTLPIIIETQTAIALKCKKYIIFKRSFLVHSTQTSF